MSGELPYEYFTNYTQRVIDDYGAMYQGRPLIGKDTDVRGGVYYGKYRGEAIVVDPENYPDMYREFYKDATQRALDASGGVDRSKVLQAVFEVVSERMQYSLNEVDDIFHEIAGGVDGQKIELSVYMKKGFGVCRHQALTCATLLERFKDEGHIRGQISVDRSYRRLPNGDRVDSGHAWLRYTSFNGVRQIMDVANNYRGPLNDGDELGWEYRRPEEIIAGSIGETAVSSS